MLEVRAHHDGEGLRVPVEWCRARVGADEGAHVRRVVTAHAVPRSRSTPGADQAFERVGRVGLKAQVWKVIEAAEGRDALALRGN